jgi:ABC-2 type transport system permease protein
MLHRILLRKSIRDGQLLFWSLALVIFAFAWLRVYIVSTLEMGKFEQAVELFREQIERFASVPLTQLLTYGGRIAVIYNEPIIALSMLIWCVARGSDAVAGDLGRGSLEMVLAQPVSRFELLASHSTVTIVGAALLACTTWLGTTVGIHAVNIKEPVALAEFSVPMTNFSIRNPLIKNKVRIVPLRSRVEPKTFANATFNLFSFGVCFSGIATLLSAVDRYRWRAIGIAIAIFVIQTILKVVSMSVEGMGSLHYGTLLTCYDPERFVAIAMNQPENTWGIFAARLTEKSPLYEALGPMGHCAILLGVGIAAYFAALRVFVRRDLPAPL